MGKVIVDKATGETFTSWDLFFHEWRKRNGITATPAQGDHYDLRAAEVSGDVQEGRQEGAHKPKGQA